jgi:hypothetical protein
VRITGADLALLAGVLAALVTTAFISARGGAIALGGVFLVGLLLRARGIASLLLTQRRQRTDLLVLGAFGVTLIALALVLP